MTTKKKSKKKVTKKPKRKKTLVETAMELPITNTVELPKKLNNEAVHMAYTGAPQESIAKNEKQQEVLDTLGPMVENAMQGAWDDIHDTLYNANPDMVDAWFNRSGLTHEEFRYLMKDLNPGDVAAKGTQVFVKTPDNKLDFAADYILKLEKTIVKQQKTIDTKIKAIKAVNEELAALRSPKVGFFQRIKNWVLNLLRRN